MPCKTDTRKVKRLQNISYGEVGDRNNLDIYLPTVSPAEPMRTLIQVRSGGWTMGLKNLQGLPLVNHMATKGWMAVSINYRLGPDNRFPTMISDVLRAIVWVKSHAEEYGGDTNFVAITGGSAGGHLESLSFAPQSSRMEARL